MYSKFLKAIIYAIVFLVPVFWLPFSFEAFEFNKVYLLAVLVTLGILIWLAKMIFQDKKVVFNKNIFNFFALAFAVVMIVNVFFAKDFQSAVWGSFGRFWPSLIGVLSMVGFYFLVSNNVVLSVDKSDKTEKSDKTTMSGLLKAFLWSGFFVVLSAYFSLFGAWQFISAQLSAINKGFALPSIMSLKTFSFVGGTLESLSMFLAFLSVLLITLLAFNGSNSVLFSDAKKRTSKILAYILLAASFGLLAITDFWPAFLAMTIGLGVFLVLAFVKKIFRQDINRLALAVFFVIISLVFVFSNPLQGLLGQTVLNGAYPEILLNQRVSWDISWQAFQENPIMGSGLANFNYGFNKFKPADFLKTQFWQARFDRSGGHIAELLSTVGAVGLLSYAALIGFFLLVSYLFIVNKTKGKLVRIKGDGNGFAANNSSAPFSTHKAINLCFIAGFITLLVGQFLYYQNTVLAFCFWLAIAVSAAAWRPVVGSGTSAEVISGKELTIPFSKFPEAALVFSIVFWGCCVATAFLYFNLARSYLADMAYREYAVNPTQNLAQLEKAVRLNEKQAVFHNVLAGRYLSNLIQEAVKSQPDKNLIANLASLAVQETRKAAEVSPNLVSVQETAGAIYRDIQGLAQGASDWSMKSFENALSLEPKNPVLLTEIGKLKLAKQDIEGAVTLFNQAIALKGDYTDAYMQLVTLDERESKIQEAKDKLEELLRVSPFYVDGYFQLGRLYYNEGNLDKAIGNFSAAVQLFPNHSNSLYSLGLVYEKQGNFTQALALFEKVQELNPGNLDVEKKIQDVQNAMTPAPAPK